MESLANELVLHCMLLTNPTPVILRCILCTCKWSNTFVEWKELLFAATCHQVGLIRVHKSDTWYQLIANEYGMVTELFQHPIGTVLYVSCSLHLAHGGLLMGTYDGCILAWDAGTNTTVRYEVDSEPIQCIGDVGNGCIATSNYSSCSVNVIRMANDRRFSYVPVTGENVRIIEAFKPNSILLATLHKVAMATMHQDTMVTVALFDVCVALGGLLPVSSHSFVAANDIGELALWGKDQRCQQILTSFMDLNPICERCYLVLLKGEQFLSCINNVIRIWSTDGSICLFMIQMSLTSAVQLNDGRVLLLDSDHSLHLMQSGKVSKLAFRINAAISMQKISNGTVLVETYDGEWLFFRGLGGVS